MRKLRVIGSPASVDINLYNDSAKTQTRAARLKPGRGGGVED